VSSVPTNSAASSHAKQSIRFLRTGKVSIEGLYVSERRVVQFLRTKEYELVGRLQRRVGSLTPAVVRFVVQAPSL